ncbi:hypothetical protein [Bradyrhizobium sp. ORS 86]|uniref:hypothetical protein n=1 Tax=Bradyrhizobium sp. ORS 86 TaxID=1685970 RepID=UPI00388F156A
MPTAKQMDKMAAEAPVGRSAPVAPTPGRADPMPREYWDALLRDASADDRPAGPSIRSQRLCQIARHLLRTTCTRCSRTIEIQKADAVRLYGPQAIWKDCAQRLLDDTCQVRTGRHEEDGCWPAFD